MEYLHWIAQFTRENGLVGTLFLVFLLLHFRIFDKIKLLLGISQARLHRRNGDDDDEKGYVHKRANDDPKFIQEMIMTLKDEMEKTALDRIEIKGHGIQIEKLDEKVDTEVGHIFSQLKSLHDKTDRIYELVANTKR